MLLYSIVLFLHIVGALGLFAALGLEWASAAYLRRALAVDQAREWLSVRGWVMRLGPASLALILLSGLFMVATSWGWVGWIVVALAALVLIAVLGAALTGSRIGAIQQGVAAESGTLSPTLRQRLNDPVMWISLQTRTAIALGIVFLMTVKPDGVGSLITIGVAIILGLASSLPMRRRVRAKDAAAMSRS
jgi:hypothetical protein